MSEEGTSRAFDVSSEDLLSIVGAVVDATFGLGSPDVVAKRDGPMSTAAIAITGQWDGHVTVACSPDLARRLAGLMFAVAFEDVSREHMEDVMAELANMVGGNLKALIQSPNILSLPTVLHDNEVEVTQAGAKVLHDLTFEVAGEPMRIVVSELR